MTEEVFGLLYTGKGGTRLPISLATAAKWRPRLIAGNLSHGGRGTYPGDRAVVSSTSSLLFQWSSVL